MPPAADPAPIGLGIAGLGMAGAVMVQAAAAHPGYVLRAAADPHPAPRAAFARDFNAKAYDDIGALCADPAVEVVYIATPHQFHKPHAILAAKHGKHIILEKPMALTLADCDAIIAAVEKANVHLIVGHTHAFDPAVRVMVRNRLRSAFSAALGMIHSFNYTNFLYRPRRPEELDTAQGGGILFNQVPHQIDIVRLLAAASCAACARRRPCSIRRGRPKAAARRSCNSRMARRPPWSIAATIISTPTNGISDFSERGAEKAISTAPRGARWTTADETRARTRNFRLRFGQRRSTAAPAAFRHHHCDLRAGRTARFGRRSDHYDRHGKREMPLKPSKSMPGGSEVLDDMLAAFRQGSIRSRRPLGQGHSRSRARDSAIRPRGPRDHAAESGRYLTRSSPASQSAP